MTCVPFKSAAALIFVVSIPLHLGATAEGSLGEPLTASQVPRAEATAKTQADHLRLVIYYQSKARQTESKLADAEDQMKHYSFMADRTKVPNAYTSSRSLVERYRSEIDDANKMAAAHQKMAQSLQASVK